MQCGLYRRNVNFIDARLIGRGPSIQSEVGDCFYEGDLRKAFRRVYAAFVNTNRSVRLHSDLRCFVDLRLYLFIRVGKTPIRASQVIPSMVLRAPEAPRCVDCSFISEYALVLDG